MEKYRRPEIGQERKSEAPRLTYLDEVLRSDRHTTSDRRELTAADLAQEHVREKSRKATRRKWGGRGLILLGAVLILGSCPLYAFSLIGPQTVVFGLAVIAAGSALLAWRPRLKDTNEALLVAMKHGNHLTTPRLALEMDVSLERAERIIQELVRNGIAEIDLDYQDPDHAIAYKIRGL